MTRLTVPVPLRWADLDAYGHVNNVEFLRFLEEARIAAFWRHPEEPANPWPTAILDAGPASETHTVVASTHIEYLVPLGYQREPVPVEMWLGRIGGASLDICYQVIGERDGARVVYVQARTSLVLVDAATGRPRRITPDQRAAWEPIIESDIVFRHRR